MEPLHTINLLHELMHLMGLFLLIWMIMANEKQKFNIENIRPDQCKV